MNINDSIRKFWEDSGFKVKTLNVYITEDTSCIMWQAIKYDIDINIHDVQIVAVSPALYISIENVICHIVYHWNGNQYSEEEMLKIIKLKAFL